MALIDIAAVAAYFVSAGWLGVCVYRWQRATRTARRIAAVYTVDNQAQNRGVSLPDWEWDMVDAKRVWSELSAEQRRETLELYDELNAEDRLGDVPFYHQWRALRGS